jgi:hypothetical protein
LDEAPGESSGLLPFWGYQKAKRISVGNLKAKRISVGNLKAKRFLWVVAPVQQLFGATHG